MYLGLFGLMLAGLEFPIGPLKRIFEMYFRFLYTTHGRLGFVLLVATVAWDCKQVHRPPRHPASCARPPRSPRVATRATLRP